MSDTDEVVPVQAEGAEEAPAAPAEEASGSSESQPPQKEKASEIEPQKGGSLYDSNLSNKNFHKFNLERAAYLARLASVSYSSCDYLPWKDEGELRSVLDSNFNLDLIKFVNNTESETQGFIARLKEYPNVVLLTWRGTESKEDVFSDVKALPVIYPYSGGNCFGKPKVHQGFFEAYDSVRGETEEELRLLMEQEKSSEVPYKYFVCGHSLGGAIATLCALHVKEIHKNADVCCYTFGSPRVGSGKFSDHYNKTVGKNSYRVVNDADAVSRVPPAGAFSHVDRCVFLEEDNVRVSPSLKDRISEFFNNIRTPKEAGSDHKVGNYVKQLCAHVGVPDSDSLKFPAERVWGDLKKVLPPPPVPEPAAAEEEEAAAPEPAAAEEEPAAAEEEAAPAE